MIGRSFPLCRALGCLALVGMLGGCAVVDANHTGALDALAAWKPKADFIASAGPADKRLGYEAAKSAVNAYIDGLEQRVNATAAWPVGKVDVSAAPPELVAQVNALMGDQRAAVLPVIEVVLAILQQDQYVRGEQAKAINNQLTQWRWGDWHGPAPVDTTAPSRAP